MKPLYRHIVSAAFILSVISVQAQTVKYRTLRDDPSDISKLQVRLQPFYAEGFRVNQASLGTALELRFNFNNKLLFNANRWGSFSTISEGPNNERFKLNELNMEYVLKDKSEKQDIKIVLKSSTSQTSTGTYTVSKYITVPGTMRTLITSRGGVFHYTSPFKAYALKQIDLAQVKDTARIALSGNDVSGSSMSGVAVVAGLAIHKITNIQVLVNETGKRSTEKWLSLYFDLMYAPVVKLENFTGKNADWEDSWFVIENGDNGIEKKRFGWRYGMVADFHTVKRVTFGGRVEVGSRPGIKNNGFYLRGGMGMTINLF